jgi:ribose transport system substrate-binding protein
MINYNHSNFKEIYMKRQKICVFLAGFILLAVQGFVWAGGTKEEGPSGGKAAYTIGMTVQDLSNPVWAATCQELDRLVTEDGGKLIWLDCKSNAATQITQVENFISSGVDAILIHAVDGKAVEEVLSRARAKGIKVASRDEDLTNSDQNWLADNYKRGRIIGQEAAKWINEKLGGTAEVGILDYPSIEVLLERGNGIVDALKEYAPNAKIVAQSSAINPIEGMAKTETFLQAYPNMKVIACIGGGGAVGANEAVKSSGKLTPDFGIFSIDATPGELEAIANNEAIRMTVMVVGDGAAFGRDHFDRMKKLINNEPVERKIYFEGFPVTAENISQYYSK